MTNKRRINIMLTPESVAALRALFDALGIQGQRADANLQPGLEWLGVRCQEVGVEGVAAAIRGAPTPAEYDPGWGKMAIAAMSEASSWRALPGQVNDLNDELAEVLAHLERIEAALAQPSNSVYAPVDTETAWIERARR